MAAGLSVKTSRGGKQEGLCIPPRLHKLLTLTGWGTHNFSVFLGFGFKPLVLQLKGDNAENIPSNPKNVFNIDFQLKK